MQTTRCRPLKDKWQIVKEPLWPDYPLPWVLLPPKKLYNACVLNIRCFASFDEARAALLRGY